MITVRLVVGLALASFVAIVRLKAAVIGVVVSCAAVGLLASTVG